MKKGFAVAIVAVFLTGCTGAEIDQSVVTLRLPRDVQLTPEEGFEWGISKDQEVVLRQIGGRSTGITLNCDCTAGSGCFLDLNTLMCAVQTTCTACDKVIRIPVPTVLLRP